VTSAPRYTASRGDLAERCLYWARPDIELPRHGESSAAADLGSALHEVAAAEALDFDELEGGDELFGVLVRFEPGISPAEVAERWALAPSAVEELQLLRDAWRSFWMDFSLGRSFRTEVPFAFDTATGTARELPSTGQRDYSACTATEIPGTVDAIALDLGEGRVVVVDLKTGKGPKRVADYRRQLLHGAVCAARAYGVERARIAIAHVTADGVRLDEEDVGAEELEEAAQSLVRDLARLPLAAPMPGLHCSARYCPLRATCPATVALVAQADVDELQHVPLRGDVEDERQARALALGLPRLAAWIDDRRRALRAFVDARGAVRLDDGHAFGRFEEERETPRLDVHGAREALEGVLGDRIEFALEVKTTKAAIERAARRVAADLGGRRGELKKIKTAAFAALRAAHAMKRSRFTVYEVRSARAAPDALPAVEESEVRDG
jgi:PD-(D/E)XK nuclease superfamily